MTLSFDLLALAVVALIALRWLVRAVRHDLGRAERLRYQRDRRLSIG